MIGKGICSECEEILKKKAVDDFDGDKNLLDMENASIIGGIELTIPYNTKEGLRFHDYYADMRFCVCCGKKCL